MFKLSTEAEVEWRKAQALELNAKQTFASMTDSSLVSSAKFWMAHCDAPKRIQPDQPIYDSTFWHAIVPELIKRLEKK